MGYDYISLVCPRCGHKFKANYCNNCNSLNTIKLEEYQNGWFGECTRCGMAWQWWECPKCGANVNVYKNKACFLTQACCSYMGKEDDCDELTILRNFRDGYMLQDVAMAKDVEQYYEIAPKIVTYVENHGKQAEFYREVYHELVCPCIDMIKNEKYPDAYQHYKKFVFSVCGRWNIEN